MVFALGLSANAQNPSISTGEGFIETGDGRIWYKIVGTGDRIPLLLLHGGPGFSTYYMQPLEALGDERPVIFFDQLGSGRSDVTSDPSLWTMDHFVQQVKLVRERLHLDEVHLLGHSWGTQLAIDYLLTGPPGVTSLILASPAINVQKWTEDNKALLRQLPDDAFRAIEKHERAGTTDSEEYQAAMMVFYHRHISRSDPWSEELNKAFETANLDLYGYMWGVADWAATGTLKDYNREAVLPSLDLPVLFTTGRFDEARPETVAYFQSLVKGSELAILENSGHLTMQDEPDLYNQIVREFLRRVESQVP